MIFNSFNFIFFFLFFSIVPYFFLSKLTSYKFSIIWLLIISVFFYFLWSVNFLFYLITSVIVNYLLGKLIIYYYKKKKFLFSKLFLFFSIILNLFYLGIFKYYNFFSDILNNLFILNLSKNNFLLPIGISFYTLQQIAYLVQCYGGEVENYNKKNFLKYFLFVIFFPKIVAGPIVNYKDFSSQFKKNIFNINFNNLSKGLFLFSIGLFKKVILADHLAIWTNNGFSNIYDLNFFESWILCYSYSFQLYFDVSSYADMAIGAALFFNLHLPINFSSPYKQKNISDLWNSWHMTLTQFINNYIYRPIIFSFKNITSYKIVFSIITTMLIAGLWHGANWTFVMLGLLNGIAIAIYHLVKDYKIILNKYFAIFITFTFFSISLLFFRVNNLEEGYFIILSMFSFDNIMLPGTLHNYLNFLSIFNIKFGTWLYSLRGDYILIIFLITCSYLIFFCDNSHQLTKNFKPNIKNYLIIIFGFSISILFLNNSFQSIYFKF